MPEPATSYSPAPPLPAGPAPVMSSPPPPRKSPLLIVIALLIVVIIGLAAWLVADHLSSDAHAAKKASSDVSQSQATGTTFFYATAKKLSNLDFFSNPVALFGQSCSASTASCSVAEWNRMFSYYQIGQTASGQPIIAVNPPSGASDISTYVAVETAPNSYTVYGRLTAGLDGAISSNDPDIGLFKQSIASNVSLNANANLSGLDFPQSVSVQGVSLTLPSDLTGPQGYFIPSLSLIRGNTFGAVAPSAITKLATQGDMTFYEVDAENMNGIAVKEFYAVIGGVYAAEYVLVDPITTGIPGIIWSDGLDNTNTYTAGAQGCGSAYGIMTIQNPNPSELIVAGEGPNQTTVYELSPTSSLFNYFYTTYYDKGIGLNNSSVENLSATAFQNDAAVIVTQDGFHDYIVYVMSQIFVGGECGKPVIYLYPTRPTSVNLAVGAAITNSDPTYPAASGWRDVLAQPDGSLSYLGHSYPYLFWEGQGDGPYPLLTTGSVVQHAQAEATMQSELLAQGLSEHEANDFLAYWVPKIPATPYVRLSWLTTAQMNRLAPLTVSPAPETILRVFLDMSGLSQPLSLPAPHFSAPLRRGFTLVEWGGLLQSGD